MAAQRRAERLSATLAAERLLKSVVSPSEWLRWQVFQRVHEPARRLERSKGFYAGCFYVISGPWSMVMLVAPTQTLGGGLLRVVSKFCVSLEGFALAPFQGDGCIYPAADHVVALSLFLRYDEGALIKKANAFPAENLYYDPQMRARITVVSGGTYVTTSD